MCIYVFCLILCTVFLMKIVSLVPIWLRTFLVPKSGYFSDSFIRRVFFHFIFQIFCSFWFLKWKSLKMGKWRKRHYFYYYMFKWPLSELLYVLCALCTFNWFQFCTNLGPFRKLFCNKSTKQKKWFYDLVKENLWNILISGTRIKKAE